ncbi:hypothetical protein Trydic_g21891 [Trypoxylus dichotomus]
MLNSRGEIADPCGTPAVAVLDVDRCPSSSILKVLWRRKEWMSLTITLEMPARCIFKSRPWCQTLSKASATSRNTAPVYSRRLKPSFIYSTMRSTW